MKNLMQVIGGVTYDKNDVGTSGIRILRGGNLSPNNSIVCLEDDVFLPAAYACPNNQVVPGDIVIVASTGSTAVIGKAAFVNTPMPSTQIGGFLRIVRPINSSIATWLQYIFLTNYYRTEIVTLAKGTNINNVKAGHLEELLVPVPPERELHALDEQLRQMFIQITNISTQVYH